MLCVGREGSRLPRLTVSAIDSLKLAFEESEHLTKDKKMELARATGLDMEQVTSWFNRKRARKRAKVSILKLERVNAELGQLLQQCREREAELLKELEEGRVREAELVDENLRLKRPTVWSGDGFCSWIPIAKGHFFRFFRHSNEPKNWIDE
ncbi:hypothetical protein OROMI_014756 [Orobanche minor]